MMHSQMSPEQQQMLANELYMSALTESIERDEMEWAEEWRARSDRWKLPIPDSECDPGDPMSHDCPLGAISWIFPKVRRDQVPMLFWDLLDRMWGVHQADEMETRILVEDVEFHTVQGELYPKVEFGEPEESWGAKLVSMMYEVREEMVSRGWEDFGMLDQIINSLMTQIEAIMENKHGKGGAQHAGS
ncbi:hypothetical protein ACUIAC_02790 [Dermabacteraceae bacterium P13138]